MWTCVCGFDNCGQWCRNCGLTPEEAKRVKKGAKRQDMPKRIVFLHGGMSIELPR
jgi:hypothetical protein